MSWSAESDRSERCAGDLWDLSGVPVEATANVASCLTLLGRALRLPDWTGEATPRRLRIEVFVQSEWAPPTWLDETERLWSRHMYYYCRSGDDPIVVYDGVAWARLFIQEQRLVIRGDRRLASDEFVLTQAMLMPLLPIALRSWNLLPLHACAVDWQGQAIVFPAVSGSGKSTLALALLRGGYKLLSDDMPMLRREADGSFRLLRFPERCRVTPNSLDFFPDLQDLRHTAEPSGGKLMFDPAALFGNCWADESRPVALVVPAIAHGPGSRLESCGPSVALKELLAGVRFGAHGGRLADLFSLLVDFVATCRTYSLATGTEVAPLPALLRQVLEEDSRAFRRI